MSPGINDIEEILSEGIRTAFLRAGSSETSDQIGLLIGNLPATEWHAIVSFVARGLEEYGAKSIYRSF